MTARPPHPVTPDGRYFVVRGRLWRMADPRLSDQQRAVLVSELMRARRAVANARRSGERGAEAEAHAAVDRAKVALGERGPVWWSDDAPDLNRHLARTGPYAAWYAALGCEGDGTPLARSSADLIEERAMAEKSFKAGDHVKWNTPQGETTGRVVKTETSTTRPAATSPRQARITQRFA